MGVGERLQQIQRLLLTAGRGSSLHETVKRGAVGWVKPERLDVVCVRGSKALGGHHHSGTVAPLRGICRGEGLADRLGRAAGLQKLSHRGRVVDCTSGERAWTGEFEGHPIVGLSRRKSRIPPELLRASGEHRQERERLQRGHTGQICGDPWSPP